MAKVYIPSPLRAYAGQQSTVEVDGATVGDVLATLSETYPELRAHLFHESGELRSFVNIFVNSDDIRLLDKENTPVTDRDEISLVPPIAGGSGGGSGNGALSNDEITRYSRHLILPEVTLEGQRKLKAASVLIIGAGGLGSPLAMYLAAAGIGRLGIVDFDRVDVSNLQRQIMHKTSSVDRPKIDSARETIAEVNPHVEVAAHETRLTAENALEIARDYDIVIDGTDNFPTRYLVNDVCVLLGKPNVYGSIFRFEGQASVFWAGKGPCYRCLFPEPPPPGMVPSCAEGGVLGVLPGVIGVIQATEAIKIILGKGEPLIGRLLLYDSLAMRFRELSVRRNPDCPICGDSPAITELIDYEEFCGVAEPEGASDVRARDEVLASELAEMLKSGGLFLLDVRKPFEWDICHIEGAQLIPLDELHERLSEVDGTREIVAYCRTGVRSREALDLLHRAGYRSARHLKGGIHAWIDEVEPELAKY